MREYEELKLARVVDACGGIDGRVKMQKIVYLLMAMGYELPYDDFTIRQLGPFSRSLAWDTDTLRGAGILSEEPIPLGDTPEGRSVVQYSYAVRDQVAPLIREHFDVPVPEGRPQLEKIARELKEHDRKVLEVAATRLFLERESDLHGDDFDAELERLKGHLSARFPEANALLDELYARGLL
ncbi:MAG: hypothetical protein ACYSUI_09620 [Planctomycetota bacterium]|jgi:hypothetical protein